MFEYYGYPLPAFMHSLTIFGCQTSILAVLFILAVTALATRGSRSSTNANNVFTTIKVVLCLVIVVAGFTKMQPANFEHTLAPAEGIRGIIQGGMICYFGYSGFDIQNQLTNEAINPQQNIPRAMMFTLVAVGALYVAFAVSITGINIVEMAQHHDADTALALAFKSVGMDWMAALIYWAALVGAASAALTNVMGQARVCYVQARDGLFFKVFKEIDEEKGVPVKGPWL